MRLETDRPLIGNLRTEVADALVRLRTDPEVTRFTGGPRNHADVLATLREDAALEDPRSSTCGSARRGIPGGS